MVMYDSYEKKIKKIAIVKNFVVKFKVVFISLLALIVVLTTSFLSTKGVVTQNTTLPSNEFVYGEEFEPTDAKALFSDYYYEYRSVESDVWSRVKPRVPGNYQLRVVTEKSFGAKGYGKPIDFTIYPKDLSINIKDTNITYGNNPIRIESEGIVSGDTLMQEQLSFIFATRAQVETNVKVDVESVIISDAEGNDVTHCYNVITPETLISYDPKVVNIQPLAVEKVYDGKPFEYNNELTQDSYDSMIWEDNITVETIIKDASGNVLEEYPTEVGTYTIEIVPETINVLYNKENTTDNYKFNNILTNTMVIKHKELSITTKDATKIYDTTALSYFDESAFTDNGTLIQGHKLVLDETRSSEFASITNVGSVANKLYFKVLDENDVDVTHNYKLVNENFGTLTITAKDIEVTTYNATKIYDGEALTYQDSTSFDVTGLMEGHYAVLDKQRYSAFGTITNVGSVANSLYFKIYDQNGNDVTNNYNILKEAFGTLTVEVRDIEIETYSATKTYDGTALTAYNSNDFAGINLAATDYLVVDETAGVASITLKGKTTNKLTFKVFNKNGEDVTYCYNITKTTYGELEVTPRSIELSISPQTFTYQGSPIDYVSEVGSLTYSQIVYGETATIKTVIKDASGNEVDGTPTDAGDYLVYITEFAIFNKDGEDVTTSYEADTSLVGNLTINKKYASINVVSGDKVYDGLEYSYNSEITTNGIVTGETAVATTLIKNMDGEVLPSNPKYVGDYYINILEIKVLHDNKDVTHNYELTLYDGYINIYKQNLELQPSIASTKVYDGKPMAYNKELTETSYNNLASMDHIVINTNYDSIANKNNGGYTLAITDVTILDNEDKDVTFNYNISTLTSYFEITQRNINIQPKNNENKVYDGTYSVYEHAGEENNFVYANGSEVLVYGESLVINTYFTDVNGNNINPINVGTYYIHVLTSDYLVYVDGEIEWTYNYNISYEPVSFEITKKAITITSASSDKIYDGEALTNYYSYDSTELANINHYLELDWNRSSEFGTITNVGSVANTMFVRVYDSTGNDVSSNYDISYVYGQLEVLIRDVTITTHDASKVYDGTELTYWSYSAENVAFNQYADFNYEKLNEFGTVTNVYEGDIENKLYFRVYDAYGNDVSANYNITYVWGKLSITPREIHFTAYGQDYELDKIYDGTYYKYRLAYQLEYTDISSYDSNYQLVMSLEEFYTKYVYSYHFENVSDEKVNPIDAGTYYIVIDKFESLSDHTYETGAMPGVIESQELTNYNFIFHKKEFEIEKRRIDITPMTGEKIYDGKVIDYSTDANNFEYAITTADFDTYELATGEDLFIAVKYYEDSQLTKEIDNPKDVGLYYLGVDLENSYIMKMMLNWDIQIIPFKESQILAIQQTLDNYDIHTYSSTYEIKQRTIYIAPKDDGNLDKVYDDTAYEYKFANQVSNFDYQGNSITNPDNQLVEGEELMISVRITDLSAVDSLAINVGNYAIVVNVLLSEIIIGEEHYTTKNYKIVANATAFEITRRQISIETYGGTKQYDGTALTKRDDVDYNASNLVDSHYLVLDYSREREFGTVTNVYEGEVDNTLYFKVYNSLGDVSDNYEIISETWGKLSITKRAVHIAPIDVNDITYNAYNYDYTDYVNSYNGYKHMEGTPNYIVTGENLDVAYYYTDENGNNITPKHIGTYNIHIDLANTKLYKGAKYDASGLENYDISCSTVSFEITKKVITLQVEVDSEKVYDGELMGFEGLLTTESILQIAGNDKAVITTDFADYASSYVGVYEIKITSVVILDEEGNDVTFNYDFNENGELLSAFYEIIKRDVTFIPKDIEKEYDGIAILNPNDIKYESADIVNNQVALIYSYILDSNDEEVYKPLYAGNYYIHTSEVKIYAEDGTDVTFNYNVDHSAVGSIKITPRNISVTPDSFTKTYNGKPIAYNNEYIVEYLSDLDVVAQALVNNDKLTIETIITDRFGNEYDINNLPVNAGEYAISIVNITITNSLGEDITSSYNCMKNTGKLTINKREITIELLDYADIDKIYDGYEHVYIYDNLENNFVYADGSLQLASGEVLVIRVVYNTYLSPIDAGNYVILMDMDNSYIIKDGNEYSLDNYKINVNTLEFSIYKREVQVIPLTFENVIYTGKPFVYQTGEENYHLDANSLPVADNDGLEIYVKYQNVETLEFTYEPIEVGVYSIILDSWNIVSGNINNNNYEVTATDIGSLEIVRCEMSVSVKEMETITYDGLEHSYHEGLENYIIDEVINEVADNVIPVFTIKVVFDDVNTEEVEQYESVVHAGTYKMIIVSDSYEGESFIINYKDNGATFTILPKEITIAPKDITITYNSRVYEYEMDNSNYVAVLGDVVNRDKIQITVKFIDENGEEVSPKFVGTYTIVIDEWAVKTGNRNNNNYIVNKETGTLRINAKKITVQPVELEKEYDGLGIGFDGIITEPDRISINDRDNVSYTYQIINENTGKVLEGDAVNAGNYIINITGMTIINKDNIDVTDQYIITFSTGTITINPRKLVIETLSDSKLYDGTPLTNCDENDYFADRLVLEHKLVLDVNSISSITNYVKDGIDNALLFTITNGKDEDLTYNYDISYVYGNLSIIRRDLYINPIDIDGTEGVEYDGTVATYDAYVSNFTYEGPSKYYYENQLVTGEELTIHAYFTDETGVTVSPKNVGTYFIKINLDNGIIIKDGIEYATTNYVLHQNSNVTYKINHRIITVEAVDDEKVYDGYMNSYESNQYNITSNSLVNNHELNVKVIYKQSGEEVDPINVGKYDIYIDSSLSKITYFGDDVTSNYIINASTNPATLTINVRDIYLVVNNGNDKVVVYDKNVVSKDDLYYASYYEDKEGNTTTGFVLDDSNYFVPYYQYLQDGKVVNPINAGTYEITINENSFFTNETVARNYNIIGIYNSTLIIEKRVVVVSAKLDSTSKEYDGKSYVYEVKEGNYNLIDGSLAQDDTLTIYVDFFTTDFDNLPYELTTNGTFKDSVSEAARYTLLVRDALINGLENPNYEILTSNESVVYEITPRDIRVTNGSLTATYTGDKIYAPDSANMSSNNILDEDDKLFIDSLSQTVERNRYVDRYYEIDVNVDEDGNVIPYENKQSISIVDSLTKDEKSHNYNIELINGQMLINQREISFTVHMNDSGNVFTYDKESHTPVKDKDYAFEGLAKGHSISGIRWTTIRDAGTYSDYTIRDNYIIIDSLDMEVKKTNYKIVYAYREVITINPCVVSFELQSEIGKEYNAKEQSFSKAILRTDSNTHVAVDISFEEYEIYDSEGKLSRLLDAGVYTIVLRKENVLLDSKLNNPNYILDIEDVISTTYTIAKYDLGSNNFYLRTNDSTKAYDGDPLVNTGFNYYFNEDGKKVYELDFGHAIVLDETKELPFAINPEEYVINDLPLKVIDKFGNDVTHNYVNLKDPRWYHPGTLYVTGELYFTYTTVTYNGYGQEPSIHARPQNIEMTYDIVGYMDEQGNMLDYVPILPGNYRVLFNNVRLTLYKASTGEHIPLEDDILNMFNVTNQPYYDYGSLSENVYYMDYSIDLRNIYVKPMDIYQPYDGSVVECGPNDYEIIGGYHIVDYHELYITTTHKISNEDLDTRISNNMISSYYILDKNTGEDVTHYYNVYTSYEDWMNKTYTKRSFYGKLEIEQRILQITPHGNIDNPYVYDGEKHSVNGFDIVPFEENIYTTDSSIYGLLPGHYAVIKEDSFEKVKPGEYLNRIKIYIQDENGNDVTDGYNYKEYYTDDVENKSTYLVIKPKDLIITSGSATMEYDGSTLTCDEYTYEGLIGDDQVEVIINGSIESIGSTANTFLSVKVMDKRGREDKSDYYNIILVEGTLTITKPTT